MSYTDQLLDRTIHAAERGAVPDSIVRAGIRLLLRQRLSLEAAPSCEAELQARQKFIASMRASPVALVPAAANEQHYEVPPTFFEAVLGTHLKYSSAYFAHADDSLDVAEAAMLKLTAQRAGLVDGMRILELGCGWGSLTLWMAEHFPHSQIVAVSNSSDQRQTIVKRAAARGLSNVSVITADMNDFDTEQRFDRIVSVEMFEHMRNYEQLLSRVSNWLAPGGEMFIHIFCHRLYTYPFEEQGASNWMGQNFFSGGIMPADDLLYAFNTHMVVEDHHRVSGKHYQRTADAWLANLDQRWGRARQALVTAGDTDAEVSLHRWRIFFMACSELFGYRDGNEWWVSHYRLAPRHKSAAKGQAAGPSVSPTNAAL